MRVGLMRVLVCECVSVWLCVLILVGSVIINFIVSVLCNHLFLLWIFLFFFFLYSMFFWVVKSYAYAFVCVCVQKSKKKIQKNLLALIWIGAALLDGFEFGFRWLNWIIWQTKNKTNIYFQRKEIAMSWLFGCFRELTNGRRIATIKKSLTSV